MQAEELTCTLETVQTLAADINARAGLPVDIAAPVDLDVAVQTEGSIEVEPSAAQPIEVELQQGGSGPSIAPYNGKYEVIPTLDGETLQIKNKYMAKDLTVQPIPYFEVSNASGGETVYIAGEIEFE